MADFSNDSVNRDGSSCGSHHHMKALSFFTFSVSVVLTIATILLNGAIVVSFVKNRKLLKKSLFQKTILNIAIADLLTGFFSDGISIAFHIKEALDIYSPHYELVMLHCTLFFINGVSILTMVLLCIERIIAIVRPLRHRHGIGKVRTKIALCLTWIFSAILVVPYFKLGYIKYLIIFSYFTVVVAGISLVVTAIIYNKELSKNSCLPPSPLENIKANNKGDAKYKEGTRGDIGINNERISNKTQPSNQKKRAIKSFLIMLLVFVITYLPACIMTAYMSACVTCNCVFIHISRDLTYLFILMSATLRPLNFILVLKTIKKNVIKLICKSYGEPSSTFSSS